MNMLIEAEQYLAIDKKTFEQQSYRFRSPRWSDDVYNQIVATLVHGTKPNGPNQDATASLKRKILRDFSIDNDGRLIRKGSPSKPYDKVCLKEKQVFDAVALEHLFCHRMDPSIGASRETERVVPLLYHGVTRDAVREIVKLCRQCHLPEETPHDVNPRQLRVHRKLPKSIRTLLADDEVDESSSSPSSPNGKGATASVPREQNSDTSGQDNPTSDSTFAEPAAILHGPFERSKLGLPSTTDTSNAITSSVPIVPVQCTGSAETTSASRARLSRRRRIDIEASWCQDNMGRAETMRAEATVRHRDSPIRDAAVAPSYVTTLEEGTRNFYKMVSYLHQEETGDS